MYQLNHPTNSSLNVTLKNVTSDSFADEREEAVLNLIGRGRHVDYGTDYGRQGTLSAQLRDDGTTTARQKRQALEALKDSNSWVNMVNPFGDTIKVSLGQLQFNRIPGVALHEAVDVTIPYMEVA